MQKSNKKAIVIIVILSILLLGTAITLGVVLYNSKSDDKNSGKNKEHENAVENTEHEKDTEESEADNASDNSNNQEEATENLGQSSLSTDNNTSNSFYTVSIDTKSYYVYDEAKFNGKCDTITLTGNNYPKLSQAVNTWSNDYYAVYEELQNEYIELSKNIQQAYETYFIYNTITTSRTDEKIFSIKYREQSYCGEPVANDNQYGVTFDSQTGKELALSDLGDIETDMISYMVEFVNEHGLQSIVGDDFENDLTGTMGSSLGISWGLDGDGVWITYYASDEAGNINFVIPYNELPNFKSEYLPEGTSFTYIPEYGSTVDEIKEYGYYTDINSDGTNEFLKLDLQFDEYGYGFGINVNVDAKSFQISDLYFYTAQTYLMRTQDNTSYLLITLSEDNDYKTLYVYKITIDGIENVNVYTSTYIDCICGDEVKTYSRINRLGTYIASRTYTFVDGKLMPIEDRYYLNNDKDLENSKYITTKQEINVKLMENDKLTDATLPAGTNIYPYDTDNTSVMGFYLEDGTYGELQYEFDEEIFIITIDGISEYDLFDNVMYAG